MCLFIWASKYHLETQPQTMTTDDRSIRYGHTVRTTYCALQSRFNALQKREAQCAPNLERKKCSGELRSEFNPMYNIE